MIPLQLTEIAAALDCPPPKRDATIEYIASDSRKVREATLFAALPGSKVDGHDYADVAVKLGAVALLVSRPLEVNVPQLVVRDVLLSLGKIAALLRKRLDPVVIGITGSNGKTTVKEMIAGILRQAGPVLATQGNYNNELGLPLSLFGLEQKHRYAVLEMGASRPGDIAYLASIARPDVALVNNIGPAHLKGFGSIEGVAQTKGEIYAALREDGCAVMNADEPWLDRWRSMSRAAREITFGVAEESDVRLVEEGGTARIETPQGAFDLDLPLPGRHNLLNAAAATAMAIALGIDLELIRNGLENAQPVPGRLNVLQTAAGWTVIDDTYNANPASLYSALQVLTTMKGEPWLVLGDMKELGTDSSKMHREVGEAARVMGVRRLFVTGPMSQHMVDLFGPGAIHFESRDELVAALCRELHPGVNCLVKGSRSMGMEAVVQAVVRESELREAS